RLADRELYVLIPELLQIARTQPADDGPKLAALIDDWLVGEYAELIRDMRLADRRELAESLLGEALKDYPESTALLELVTESSTTEKSSDEP
ncbi:MAG: hypothetical protein AAFX06_33765, partial [Planctomycetota bacterium]